MSLFRGNGLNTRYLRMDFMGGITSAVVALPLALAFGVASGAGAAAGVYGAIFVGFFAALFGGTPRQISGPTGPMTVVMASVFVSLQQQYPQAGLSMAFTAVMLAGLLQIAMGKLKLGKYFIMVPYPVISGFMTGIGVIIILLQLAPWLGQQSVSSLPAVFRQLPQWLADINLAAFLLGLITLVLMQLWPGRWAQWCPRALAALLIGTLLSVFVFSGADIALIGEIPSSLPQIHWPVLALDALDELLYAALLLAVLGSIDSLLTSLVADNMTREQHDSDRELIGQGIGNTVAGLFGGLPGAGATMRTVVNIRAGGRTGYSGAIHALGLAVIMLGAGQYAALVPMPVLAAILIKVGVDIIDWSFLRRLRKLPLVTVSLMLGVLLLTVFVDLITAVLVGVFVSNLITIERLTDIQLDNVSLSDGQRVSGKSHAAQWLHACQGQVLMMKLEGPLSFAVGRVLRQRMAQYASHRICLLDLTQAQLVGISTAMIVDEIVRSEVAAQRTIFLVGASAKVRESLAALDVLAQLDPACVLDDVTEAMAIIDQRLMSDPVLG